MADQAPPTAAQKVAEYARERLAEARTRADVLRSGPEPGEGSTATTFAYVDGERLEVPVGEAEQAAAIEAHRAARVERDAKLAENRAEDEAFRRATEAERLERWPAEADRLRLRARTLRSPIG